MTNEAQASIAATITTHAVNVFPIRLLPCRRAVSHGFPLVSVPSLLLVGQLA